MLVDPPRPDPDPPSVRERLFLIAHDEDKNFRPRLHLPALGIGLAGAAVIDLLIANRLHITAGTADLTDYFDHSPTGNPVTDHVLRTVRTMTPRPPLSALLTLLGPDLYERTLGQLVAAGVLLRTSRRIRATYRPADIATMVRIRAKVRYRLNGDQDNNVVTDALCALVSALQLHDCLLFFLSTSEIEALIQPVIRRIPELAADGTPITAIPRVAAAVRHAVGDLATAVFR